jgi:hypothetical protein
VGLESLGTFFLALLQFLGSLHIDLNECMGLVVSVTSATISPRAIYDWLVAIFAQVKIRTIVAMIADAMCNIKVACSALLKEFRCKRIVKLEKE